MGAEAAPRARRVLVCDDEPLVREVVEATLRAAGFEPVCVGGAAEAWSAFSAEPRSFDAAVIDRRLGAESGLELIARVRGVRSELPVLLVSGALDRSAQLEGVVGPAVALLAKPFRPSALVAALRGLLAVA